MTARPMAWLHYGINASGKSRIAAIADAWAQIADFGKDAEVIVVEGVPRATGEQTDGQWCAKAQIAVATPIKEKATNV